MINSNPDSPGFNSYASIDDLNLFVSSREYSLDNSKAASLLFQAMDYLNTLSWKGGRSKQGQSLAFPRVGVVIDGVPLPDNIIPKQLIETQCRLAVEAQEHDLMPTMSGEIVSESISGAVSVSYAQGTNSGKVKFAWLDGALKGLILASGATFTVRRG